MPDLSNLLGAVYGDGASKPSRDPEDEAHVEQEPPAAERGPAVPDWADDEHLDAAFAQWKPGPSADASPVERAFVKDADVDDPPPPLPDDLAAALSEALVAVSGTADDTADAGTAAFRPTPKFDFSLDEHEVEAPGIPELVVDEEPMAEAFAPAPLADEPDEPYEPHVDEVHEVEDEVAPVEDEVAPVEDEVAPVEDVDELHEVDEHDQHEVHEVDEHDAEDEHDQHEVQVEAGADHDEPTPVSPFAPPAPVVEEEPRPSVTSQRAAAAELTAASRVESEHALGATAPTPVAEPTPVSAVTAPTAVMPEPVVAQASTPGDGAAAPTTLPAGTRRWERSDDDILPEKQAKKFFSLRRG
jgi:hypothetical protein